MNNRKLQKKSTIHSCPLKMDFPGYGFLSNPRAERGWRGTNHGGHREHGEKTGDLHNAFYEDDRNC